MFHCIKSPHHERDSASRPLAANKSLSPFPYSRSMKKGAEFILYRREKKVCVKKVQKNLCPFIQRMNDYWLVRDIERWDNYRKVISLERKLADINTNVPEWGRFSPDPHIHLRMCRVLTLVKFFVGSFGTTPGSALMLFWPYVGGRSVGEGLC